ncbi:MAG: hypothetical protein II870_08615 [Synergistaceae bacterium]|nr:hypothetical protein [Synergistaceae bacterium]
MSMNGKIIITVFTDPMMGFSYESEPILERLQIEYAGRYVMSLALTRRLGIFSLPAYMIQLSTLNSARPEPDGHNSRTLIMQSFEYNDFVDAIAKL